MNRLFAGSATTLYASLLVSSSFRLAGAQPDDPAYLLEPWVRLGGPPGGIGYDIRMQPDGPDTMYVTDSGAGIFRSTDGGQSWEPINEGIESTPDTGILVFCATIDPHDPNTVWIGTQFTAQIYRSVDRGDTWEQRDDGIIPIEGEHSVRGITVDPDSQNVVYAALEEGVAGTDGIARTKGEVYKSTDAGLNWNRIWHGDNLARYVWVDPRDTQRLFVSTGIFDRNAANSDSIGEGGGVGLLRSEDGGTSWTVLDEDDGLGGLFCPSLFMHPEHPDTLVAAVSSQEGNPAQPGVFVSRDGGSSWELAYSMPSAEAVEIATGDTDVWYAAAHDFICRSDDGGVTWQEFMMRTEHRGGGVPIDLQVDPRDAQRIFVNSYGGGNMMSTDGGETWVDASAGYTGSTMKGIAVSPIDERHVLAGGANTTFLSQDGGETWRGTDIPDVSSGAVRIVSHDIGGAGIESYTLASGGFDDGNVYRSFDFGLNWESTLVVDLEAFEDSAGVPPETRYGARALAFAPSNPQKVYIGYSERSAVLFAWGEYQSTSPGFFRSSDGGVTWEQVHDLPFDNVSILTIAVHPFDEGLIYASTMTGVYLSPTGGESWEHLASLEDVVPSYPEEGLPPIYVVAIDPFDPDRVYAGSPRGGIFRSADAGSTWVASSFGMDPNEAIQDILPDPNRPGVIYATSRESGVFFSDDRALTWYNLHDGYPDVAAIQLALSQDGTVLYAGSATRGVFRLGEPDTPALTGEPTSTHFGFRLEHNSPNPFNPRTLIRYTLPERVRVRLRILNVAGREVTRLVDSVRNPGKHVVPWNGTDAGGRAVASGTYFCELRVGGASVTGKMMILR